MKMKVIVNDKQAEIAEDLPICLNNWIIKDVL
jgi:hypothetical protein